mmetsp:Transcript_55898/g.130597  ORF Transcript_55898/g.130597 Transcript_55898/m.130597 type:complete len:270 (-) Transcript_55898:121-930(-)
MAHATGLQAQVGRGQCPQQDSWKCDPQTAAAAVVKDLGQEVAASDDCLGWQAVLEGEQRRVELRNPTSLLVVGPGPHLLQNLPPTPKRRSPLNLEQVHPRDTSRVWWTLLMQKTQACPPGGPSGPGNLSHRTSSATSPSRPASSLHPGGSYSWCTGGPSAGPPSVATCHRNHEERGDAVGLAHRRTGVATPNSHSGQHGSPQTPRPWPVMARSHPCRASLFPYPAAHASCSCRSFHFCPFQPSPSPLFPSGKISIPCHAHVHGPSHRHL